MNLCILSPHRDDAAFSCGIALRLASEAALPIRVLNIFTRSDYAPFVQAEDVEAVSALRLAEDQDMLAKLEPSVTLRDLHWADAPVRRGYAPGRTLDPPTDAAVFEGEVDAVAADLFPLLAKDACVLIPLANQHVDHKVARAAAERCVPPERLAYYEDLPYFARLTPNGRSAALQTLVPPSAQATVLVHAEGHAVKRELASSYPSQVGGATVMEMATYAKRRAEQTETMLSGSNQTMGAEMIFAGLDARDVLNALGAKTVS